MRVQVIYSSLFVWNFCLIHVNLVDKILILSSLRVKLNCRSCGLHYLNPNGINTEKKIMVLLLSLCVFQKPGKFILAKTVQEGSQTNNSLSRFDEMANS